VKVLSYNICEGGAGRLSAITAVIRRQQPDAVALLEANSYAGVAALAHDSGMHLAFGEANCDYHIAWLSRSPIRRHTNHRHPTLAKTLLEIELEWEGTPLHLFATHLASRHEPLEPVDEIPVILGLIAPLAARSHLLVGDFNALRPADPVGEPPAGVIRRGEAATDAARLTIGHLVNAGYVDCYRAIHSRAPGYTYPAGAPWLRLDYIFASPPLAVRLTGCDVVTGAAAARASDHLPLWATFH
jgi:exodeoxyribonuclease-3